LIAARPAETERLINQAMPFTLEQLCRALAVHCLLSAHPDLLHEFLAPETAERTAQFILRFALGEALERPTLRSGEES
jgi:hypothetical protein